MGAGAGHRLAPRVGRIAALVGLWIVIAEGELAYAPVLAAIALIVAAIAAEYVAPRERGRGWRPWGALRFMGYFLVVSVAGGFDVARRALSRRPRLDPALTEVTVEVGGSGRAAVLFAAAVSLVPGSLCAGVEGARVTVHVIDRGRDVDRQLRELDRRVADVFAPRGGKVA